MARSINNKLVKHDINSIRKLITESNQNLINFDQCHSAIKQKSEHLQSVSTSCPQPDTILNKISRKSKDTASISQIQINRKTKGKNNNKNKLKRDKISKYKLQDLIKQYEKYTKGNDKEQVNDFCKTCCSDGAKQDDTFNGDQQVCSLYNWKEGGEEGKIQQCKEEINIWQVYTDEIKKQWTCEALGNLLKSESSNQ